jgi:phosphatidylglycerol:prolipoprotein diacylglycerol transferase
VHSHFSHTDSVTLFGALFVAALLTNWWLARRNAPRVGLDPSHVDLLLPLALIGGIAGATVAAWFSPADQQLAGEALAVDLRLRLFGIVASGAVVLFIYSRLAKLGFRSLLDVFALPTIAALAVHRLGCFYAGCCWGDLSVVASDFAAEAGPGVAAQMQTLPWLAGDWVVWAVQYAPGTWPYEQQLAVGLIGPDAPQSLPIHPVQLYEAALLVVAWLLLRRVPLERLRPGTMAAAVTLSYAVARFALEYLRADGTLVVAGLTFVQLQCVLLVGLTAAAAGYTLRGPASRPTPA